MALESFLDHFGIPTLVAGTDIARSGFGMQPAVTLLWMCGRAETTDTASGGDVKAAVGVGISPSSELSRSTYTRDLAASAVAGHRLDTSAVLVELTSGSTSAGRLEIQSVDTTGVTYNIATAFTVGLRAFALSLGGSSLTNVYAGTFNTGIATGNLAITAPNFQPDLVLFFPGPPVTTVNAVVADCTLGLGAAASSSQQGQILVGSNHTPNTMQTRRYGLSGECYAVWNAAVGAISGRATLVSMDTTGFTVNRLVANTDTTIAYLAIQGGTWAVGGLTTRTDSTNIAVTGLPFTPAALLYVSCGLAESTAGTPSVHNLWSLGAATSSSTQLAQGFSDQDALADSETMTAIEYDAVYVKSDLADGVEARMALSSIETDGFTTVMTTPEPTAGSYVLWIAGGDAPAGAPLPRFQQHYRQRRAR